MPAIASINLKLDFDQVLGLAKQLPKKQQRQLASILVETGSSSKLSTKEETFLKDLDGAVDFVNNYKKGKQTKSFKQVLDAL